MRLDQALQVGKILCRHAQSSNSWLHHPVDFNAMYKVTFMSDLYAKGAAIDNSTDCWGSAKGGH